MSIIEEILDRHQWHTFEASEARRRERLEDPIMPKPFKVFYHIACMGNWKHVVEEHESLFSRVGINPVACVLGKEEDVRWLGSRFEIAYMKDNLHEFETPTIQKLWEWCVENPTGAALYVHTKGVSVPDDPVKTAWRKLMNYHLITRFVESKEFLRTFDLVGVNWIPNGDLPHFCGNFFMTRADWARHLEPPIKFKYRRSLDDCGFAAQPWKRMHAEAWVGSSPFHSVKSLGCENEQIWTPRVFDFVQDDWLTEAEMWNKRAFELRPWFTRFDIPGASQDATYDATGDVRLEHFRSRFSGGRVLELGCFEGGHTVELAKVAHQVVAVDSRLNNLKKARLVAEIYSARNVTFVGADLERFDCNSLGAFDACFNVGLLYHLPEPWRLLRKLAGICRNMFLWSRYSAKAEIEYGGYQGSMYHEHGVEDSLSGMSCASFWPTRDELLRMLHDCGFERMEIINDESHPHGPALTVWMASARCVQSQ